MKVYVGNVLKWGRFIVYNWADCNIGNTPHISIHQCMLITWKALHLALISTPPFNRIMLYQFIFKLIKQWSILWTNLVRAMTLQLLLLLQGHSSCLFNFIVPQSWLLCWTHLNTSMYANYLKSSAFSSNFNTPF